jgi:hypothetical protein
MSTTKKAAAEKVSNNLVAFDQEVFESALEMQMSFLETATRFAKEVTDFAAHRAEANVADFSKFAEAKSPPDLMRLHFEHMRAMYEDYAAEANRLVGLAGATFGESSEAVRSTFLSKEELKKAS